MQRESIRRWCYFTTRPLYRSVRSNWTGKARRIFTCTVHAIPKFYAHVIRPNDRVPRKHMVARSRKQYAFHEYDLAIRSVQLCSCTSHFSISRLGSDGDADKRSLRRSLSHPITSVHIREDFGPRASTTLSYPLIDTSTPTQDRAGRYYESLPHVASACISTFCPRMVQGLRPLRLLGS